MDIFRFLWRGWLYIIGAILGAYGTYYILSGQNDTEPIYSLITLIIFGFSAFGVKVAWEAKDKEIEKNE
tara:strand:- start:196 stop:402 length:207 start_codon:yes stop_codon:yes gene_type:complete